MDDTIAAVATAFGEGGIGIIRISGEKSLDILSKIFVMGKKDNIMYINDRQYKMLNLESRKLYYGHIVDNTNKKILDEVMAVYMKSPKTYTAEDIVEIQCHGSIISLREILNIILKNGARLAEPGEFTKRAFLNGRLDLAQAESVIDLIKAKTEKSFEIALGNLDGSLSLQIKEIRKKILDELVKITVNIDYPDEDIEQIVYKELKDNLSQLSDGIQKLIKSSETGRILKEGFKVAIVGKPNVGKSSLMNSLLKESRAIVTDVAGTTRDTIIEDISIKNIPIKLIDTAGMRETNDIVEKIGIEKSKQAFNDSDLIIFIVDGSQNLTEEDFYIMQVIDKRKCIVLLNKSDKGINVKNQEITNKLKNCTVINTNLLENIGIDEIESEIENIVYAGEIKQSGNIFITNVRHKNLLDESFSNIMDAISMIELYEPLEMIEIDVKNAYENLGSIIGESVGDDILQEVFSRFCLGK